MDKKTVVLLALLILTFQLPVWAGEFAIWEGIPIEWEKDVDVQTKNSVEDCAKKILQGWVDVDYNIFDELYAGKTQEECDTNVDRLLAIYQESEKIKFYTESVKVDLDNGAIIVTLNLVTFIPEKGKGGLRLSFRLKKEKNYYMIVSHKFTPEIEEVLPRPEEYLGNIKWKGDSINQENRSAVTKLIADYILALNSQMPNDFVKLVKQKSLSDESKLINDLTNLPRFIKRIRGESIEFHSIDDKNLMVQLKQAVYYSVEKNPAYINASLAVSSIDGKWYINKISNQPKFESLETIAEKYFGDLKITCTVSPAYKEKGPEIVNLIKRVYDFYQSFGARIDSKEITIFEDAKVAADAQASPYGILVRSECMEDVSHLLPHELGHFTSWNGLEHLLPEEWLHEGMANFLCWYFLAQKDGKQDYVVKNFAQISKRLANPDFKVINEITLGDLTAEKFPEGWPPGAEPLYYDKAGYVIEMLRLVLGNDIFIKVYNDFLDNNKIVTTKALEQTVNKVTGKDYSWFFEQWVYRPGYPDLTFDYDISIKDDKSIITVYLKQNGDSYRLPLPLMVSTKNSTQTHNLNLTEKEQTWELKTDGMLESVTLDPSQSVFKNVRDIENIESQNYLKLKLAQAEFNAKLYSKALEDCKYLLGVQQQLSNIQLGKVKLIAGQIYDLQGKREEAVKEYKEVIDLDANPEDIAAAKAGINKPFKDK